jgi:cytochrome c
MTAPDAAATAGPDAAVVPAAATTAAGEDYAAFTGDAAAGKKVFVKCMACHVVTEGQNRVGPSLYGIVGRSAGSIAGFNYSPANKNSGIMWTEQVMFEYLKNPQAYIPGTKMVFPGLPSGQDRADVIAYLKSVVK